MLKNKIFLPIAAAAMIASAAFAFEGEDPATEQALHYYALGGEARDVRNYERARGFYADMLETASAMTPGDDRNALVFRAHSALRDVCVELELYDEAIAHGEYCARSFAGDPNFEPHDASLSYALLGSVYVYAGRTQEAYCCVDTAFSLLRDDSPVNYRRSIPKMLGIVAANSGDWALAEKAYRRGVAVERTLPESDELARAINLLANSIYQQDRYDEALPLYHELVDINRRLFGEGSEEALYARYQITNVLAFSGDVAGACRLYIDVEREYEQSLRERLRVLPGEKRDAFLATATGIMKAMTPFGVSAKANDDEFTMTAYNAIMATKGMLLSSRIATDRIISEHGSESDRQRLDSLHSCQSRLAEYEAADVRDSKGVAREYAEMLRLDAELAESCARYGDVGSFLNDDYTRIASALRPGEGVVDYYDYQLSSGVRKYVAYLYRHGMKYPHRTEICRQQSLDSVAALEKGIRSNLYAGESGDAMRQLLLDPVLDCLAEADVAGEPLKRLYFVPAGDIHKIALESLPDSAGGLLSGRLEMVRLSSAREILRHDDRETGFAGAALFGGIDFEGSEFARLPWSQREVEHIGTLLGEGSRVISGADATVGGVSAMSGNSPGLMHFSTHGFCYPSGTADLPEALSGRTDAMDLCGLVMADGILSGSAIGACDFGKTRLVSLASCDTGLGAITSEGIYGLQRAFKQAGAGSILMSLWEASDLSSTLFMTEFYNALAVDGLSARQACLQAREKVRERYPHPFYWAGYVMID